MSKIHMFFRHKKRLATLATAVGAFFLFSAENPRALANNYAPSTQDGKEPEKVTRQISFEAKAKAKKKRSGKASSKVITPPKSIAPDHSRVPRMNAPNLHQRSRKTNIQGLGWSQDLDSPDFVDRRRRLPPSPKPQDFGTTLLVGEHLQFDVHLGDSPLGMVEATVVQEEMDPRGSDPRGRSLVKLEGRIVVTGLVSLVATGKVLVESWVDSLSGAAVKTAVTIDREGFAAPYRRRVTSTDFEGRGHIRMIDDKDGRTRRWTRNVPSDTFDSLGAMAWVRSLDLKDGERASAHVMDGSLLYRVEVMGRTLIPPKSLPPLASALGIHADELKMIEGTMTRVNKFDEAIPKKQKFIFRAWLSNDERRILVLLESHIWLGVIRLFISAYDPPMQVQIN